MKRLFSLLTAFALAAALCAPVMADDVTTPDVTAPTPTPTAAIDTTSSDGVYVSAYSVTDTAGGEVTTVQSLRHTADLETGEMYIFLCKVEAWAMNIGCHLTIPQSCEYQQLRDKQEA